METSLATVNKITAFVRRVGGILVAPKETLDQILRGGPGGLSDLLLLLVLQLVAVHLQQLVRAVWFMVEVSYSGGISTFLNTISQSVLAPVVGLFIGVLGLNLATRGRGSKRNLDLAALCVVPAITLDLLLTLAAGASGWRPEPYMVIAVISLGALWWLALLVLAASLVRRDGQGAEER